MEDEDNHVATVETPEFPETSTPSSVETTEAAPTPSVPPRPKKAALSKVLPSDRLTAERQVAALRAFAAVAESNGGKPVTNESAGEAIKMAAATIVVTNAFFCDVGLLTRADGGFVVAQEAISFFRAEDGLSPELAPEKLLPIFDKQWFTQILLARLKLGPMDVTSVQKALGEASGASKEHLDRINVLIDLLCFVRWISKDGNQVRLVATSRASEPPKNPPKVEVTKPEQEEILEPGIERCSLTLDPVGKRRFVIYTPTTVTTKELTRITTWLASQLIVSDEPFE